MKPIAHIASGVILGGAALTVTGSMGAACWCCLGNVISDTDHLLEYGVYCLRSRNRPHLSEFLNGSYFAVKGTLIIAFHGYEYLCILFFLCICFWLRQRPATLRCMAFTLGYGTHLVLDLIGNDCGVKGYSILYRAAVKFDERKICGNTSTTPEQADGKQKMQRKNL